MHQARLRARPLADHPRSYPAHHPTVRVDDTGASQLRVAARELEALALHEQARHLAEVYALLAELYRRDGVQITDAELDAQADSLALLERGDRFLQDVATRFHPDGELLELARQLDDHGLGVWREAAGSLVDDCPPSLVHLRWRVEEEQRAELRSHAHLVRTEAHLGAQRRRLGLLDWAWHRGRVAGLRAELADCRQRRERSERRLAHLDTKLQVIDRTEHARAAWIVQVRGVLVRGLAAVQILAEREQQRRDSEHPAPAAGRVTGEGRVRLGRGRDRQ